MTAPGRRALHQPFPKRFRPAQMPSQGLKLMSPVLPLTLLALALRPTTRSFLCIGIQTPQGVCSVITWRDICHDFGQRPSPRASHLPTLDAEQNADNDELACNGDQGGHRAGACRGTWPPGRVAPVCE